ELAVGDDAGRRWAPVLAAFRDHLDLRAAESGEPQSEGGQIPSGTEAPGQPGGHLDGRRPDPRFRQVDESPKAEVAGQLSDVDVVSGVAVQVTGGFLQRLGDAEGAEEVTTGAGGQHPEDRQPLLILFE